MIAGCYTLHLYCDYNDFRIAGHNGHAFNEFPHEFTAERGTQCRRQARDAGWKVDYENQRTVCPKCVKAGRKFKKD